MEDVRADTSLIPYEVSEVESVCHVLLESRVFKSTNIIHFCFSIDISLRLSCL